MQQALAKDRQSEKQVLGYTVNERIICDVFPWHILTPFQAAAQKREATGSYMFIITNI